MFALNKLLLAVLLVVAFCSFATILGALVFNIENSGAREAGELMLFGGSAIALFWTLPKLHRLR